MARLCLLLAFLPAMAVAQTDAGVAPPLAVKARALADKVKLGEAFEVEVAIIHGAQQRYDAQLPADQGQFELLGQRRNRVDVKEGSVTTFVFQWSAFELGTLTTPSVSFDVTSPDGQGTQLVPGVQIEVVSSLPEEAQKTGAALFDTRPPEELPIRTWRLLYALGIAVLVAGLAYVIMRELQKRKTRPKVVTAPVIPLEQRTRQALDALRKEDLPGKGKAREFYFRLSEILRGYLGERYAFDAMEKTTPELIATLRTLHTPGLPMHQFSTFANESDFVRYAKATPEAETCKEALELAYRILEHTTAGRVEVVHAPPPQPPTRPAA